MFRKPVWSFMAVVAVAAAATAQNSGITEEEILFTEAVRNYRQQLESRADPAAHLQSVTSALTAFDGRVIVEDSVDGEFYRVIWDASLGNVVILTGVGEVALDRYTDEYGRPAFQSGTLSGWLDAIGSDMHMAVSAGDDRVRWLGSLAEASGSGTAPLITTLARECVCHGSLQLCGSSDCINNQPCTLPNGQGSMCKYHAVPAPQPDPGVCP